MASTRKKKYLQYRIAVVGCQGVGKTCLIRQFVNNSFERKHEPSRKTETFVKPVTHNEQMIQLNVDDTVGADSDTAIEEILSVPLRFASNEPEPVDDELDDAEPTETDTLLGQQKKDVSSDTMRHGYIIVYDVTNERTLFFARKFAEELAKRCGYDGAKDPKGRGPATPFVVVGNKVDLRPPPAASEFQEPSEGQVFAGSYFCEHVFASASINTGVSEAFHRLISEIQRRPFFKRKHRRLCCYRFQCPQRCASCNCCWPWRVPGACCSWRVKDEDASDDLKPKEVQAPPGESRCTIL